VLNGGFKLKHRLQFAGKASEFCENGYSAFSIKQVFSEQIIKLFLTR
jgi:hypothetical protein